jgi:hypothetical protein
LKIGWDSNSFSSKTSTNRICKVTPHSRR